MPRNSQGIWVSQEELDAENRKTGKGEPNGLNLKDDCTTDDYQKILIHQNHAIISLLSLTTNPVEAAFKSSVVDNYNRSIRDFTKN